MVSNITSISLYDSVLDGVRSYHNTVLRDVEINGETVAAPPKVALDMHNITQPF